MNTTGMIVSILVPGIVVGYIIVDLFLLSKHKITASQISYDPRIDEKIHERGENNGGRLSQEEILDNTAYLLNNYAAILSK
jgi:uncharacterized protein YneF (UPF0154 family)